MSLTVTQRPNQNGVWVAAKNPVIYKMTRKDYQWVTLTNSSGNTSIVISGVNVTSSFVAGDTIWLQSDDGAYSASGAVVSSSFSTDTTVVTSVPYVANNASGYINMTSRRPNYYISVKVIRYTTGLLISTSNYYPTKKGLATIDVSQSLQNITVPDISLISDGIILQDSNISQGFYIGYHEVWTGSANGETIDSSNISYAIYGARQIPHTCYYDDYVNLKALSLLDRILLAQGEYYCLSYISPSGGSTEWIKKSWYSVSGTFLFTAYVKSTNNTHSYSGTSVPKSVYTFFEKFSLSQPLTPDRNITLGVDVAWSANAITVPTGQFSKAWSTPFVLQDGSSATFSASFTISGNSTPIDIYVILIDKNGQALHSAVDKIATGSNGNYSGSVTATNSYSADTAFIGLAFSNSSGANKTVTMNSFSVAPSVGIGRIDFKGVDLYDPVIASLATWSNVGSGTSWTSTPSVSLVGTFVSSKYWAYPFVFTIGLSYYITYSITVPTSINYVKLVSLNDSNVLVETFDTQVATYSGSLVVTPTLAATKIAFVAQSDDAGGTESVTLNSFSLDNTVYLETAMVFDTISGYPIACNKNAVTLMWRNSLGGESSWSFIFSQDSVFKLQDVFKNQWLTVYDNSLTLAQYNALHDMFTLGQVYQTPIIEMLSTIDKTEARIGQQVYIVDSSGNKTGVIVIPSDNKTMTKRTKHLFSATVELPEVFT